MSRPPLPPIDFRALNDALLSRALELVSAWLPDGERRGHEYVCGSLSGGSGDSCSINLNTGQWADFAGDEKGGDLLSLYAAIHSISQGQAALRVAREEGLEDVAGIVAGAAGESAPPPPPRRPPPPAPSRETDREQWISQPLVPPHAPKPTFWNFYRSEADRIHTAEYRLDDHLLGYVVRFRTSDGGKETLPYTWCKSERDGSAKWHWKTWNDPRPLYYPLHRHPAGRTVVLVEGEIKAEVLQHLLEQGAPGVYCVASWPGGSKGWKKAAWGWLAGSTVLLWPDCDSKRKQPSKAAQKSVVDQAMEQLDKIGGQITDNDRERTRETVLKLLAETQPYLAADKQPGKEAMLGIGALLRDSHGCSVSMLPCEEPGVRPDGWDARDAIETDGWDFERALAYFASAVVLLAPAVNSPPPPAQPPAEPPGDAPAAAGGGDDGDGKRPWWLRPYWDPGKGRWLVSRKLVITALTCDPALEGVLGVNQLSNNIDARRSWPWPHGKAGPITGAVDLLLGRHLSQAYGLPSINRAALSEAIETVAHEQPYHPVRDYLAGLEHDGVARVDKWLIFAIGETPETLPKPVFEYLTLVGRFLLLGMVNRVMNPGCKFDYCPVFEGPGGLGKSTLVETLAGPGFFSDTHFDVSRGKEGQEQVQGLWVYEIAELANFGKAEIALIKAFISAKVDRYRPSYGRVVEAYRRQCVLIGTTNENTYLRDRTGNRRFWPVPVRFRINIPWVSRNRDQLLAEAYVRYQNGERFTPTPEEEIRLFVPMQESRLVETAVLSELQNVLTRAPTAAGIGAVINELAEFVTMAQLCLALGVDAAKSNAALEAQIRSWMDHEGWQRIKRQVNGVRAWGYARPKDWPPRDDEPPAALEATTVIHGGADDEPF